MEIIKLERSLSDKWKQLYRSKKCCEACRRRKQMDTQAHAKSNASERLMETKEKDRRTDIIAKGEKGKSLIFSVETEGGIIEKLGRDCPCCIN